MWPYTVDPVYTVYGITVYRIRDPHSRPFYTGYRYPEDTLPASTYRVAHTRSVVL
jgi:hypothetical protein